MIVVGGEALIDVFAGPSTDAGLQLDARVGGSPFNVAIGLARLDRPVAFFGALSSGFLGDRLHQALRDEGVSTACTTRLQAPCTLGLVGLDAHGVASYDFYGSGAADRLLSLASLHLVPPCDAVHVGSFALVVEPAASTLRALVERERGRAVISYDPNVRLHVEPRRERWRATLDWMASRCHLLKISAEDLMLLYPQATPEAMASQWLAAGVALVVVTRGGDGATAWTAAHRIATVPVAVDVVDTVGAGDSFQAALLTALAELRCLSAATLRSIGEGPLREALQFATSAAALTCTRRGAQGPRRTQLPSLR